MLLGHRYAQFLSSFLLFALCVLSSNAIGQSVSFRLGTTTADGESIANISVGETFLLNTYVTDSRDENAEGVFAGYLDIEYDPLAKVTGSLQYGPDYQNVTKGELAENFINDAGAVSSSLTPIGNDEFLLFSLEMEATTAGDMTFVSKYADNSPTFDVLLFNMNTPIPEADIDFGAYTLTISESVPEPSGALLGLGTLFGVVAMRRQMRPKR